RHQLNSGPIATGLVIAALERRLIEEFVQHGLSRPLHTRFVEREYELTCELAARGHELFEVLLACEPALAFFARVEIHQSAALDQMFRQIVKSQPDRLHREPFDQLDELVNRRTRTP